MAGKNEYKNKWISENRDRINLVVEKGKKELIKAHADKYDGGSVNAFINRAIDYMIIEDNANRSS